MLELKDRFAGARLPQVDLVDMRQQSSKQWLSFALKGVLKTTLDQSQQALLFLNRRGYAPLTLCRTCGHRFMCPVCAVWLVQHKAQNHTAQSRMRLECHHCGFHQALPNCCPHCQAEDQFIACGPGVERIEEEVKQAFPNARVLVVTSDRLTNSNSIDEVIVAIKTHQVDIIIGTQILAKGHHFPLLTLVGVIDADLGLSGGDLRASEKTYQLLHQVAGRAGREKQQGYVLLQTHYPDHPLFQALQAHDRDAFYACELLERQKHGFPPFGNLASLIVSGLEAVSLEAYVRLMAREAPFDERITMLGPVIAPIARLKGRYRWRFLLKSEQPLLLQNFIKHWLSLPSVKRPVGNIRVSVDIDPYSFF